MVIGDHMTTVKWEHILTHPNSKMANTFFVLLDGRKLPRVTRGSQSDKKIPCHKGVAIGQKDPARIALVLCVL